ncbi:MAG: hypothetical protein ACI9EF_002176, partial [Pseudohongiellaceae bacterium]
MPHVFLDGPCFPVPSTHVYGGYGADAFIDAGQRS